MRTIEFYCLLHQLFEVAVDEHQIKDYRNRHCCQFCERYREPDAVDAEKFWQKKHRGDLNDERAQERNERAGCTIVEPREKRRTEDIETADEK